MSQNYLKNASGFSSTEVFRFIDDVFQDRMPLLADEIAV